MSEFNCQSIQNDDSNIVDPVIINKNISQVAEIYNEQNDNEKNDNEKNDNEKNDNEKNINLNTNKELKQDLEYNEQENTYNEEENTYDEEENTYDEQEDTYDEQEDTYDDEAEHTEYSTEGEGYVEGLNLSNILQITPEMSHQIDNQVETRLNEIMNLANEQLFIDINLQIIDIINIYYLRNLQYEHEYLEIIRYTIRYSLLNLEFELRDICSNILYYAISGMNETFERNYEDVIHLLRIELKAILRRSYVFSLFNNVLNPQIHMEDIKMILNEEELLKIQISVFKNLDQEIKELNYKCSICQEDNRDNDEVRILNCKHIFHKDCIDPWLSEHSYKCPCCRKAAGKQSPKI